MYAQLKKADNDNNADVAADADCDHQAVVSRHVLLSLSYDSRRRRVCNVAGVDMHTAGTTASLATTVTPWYESFYTTSFRVD